MRVCFVTSSFIRSAGDHYARFVYEQAKCLLTAENDVAVIVVAPHAPGLALRERIDGLEIWRARYFWPSSWQRLAYQHEGLFQTVRSSWLAALQLPCLLMAMLIKLWLASRGARVLHAQWVPTAAIALIVGWLRGIPVVVSVRGADLNTALRSAVGRWLTRFIIDRASQVLTVSDEFKDVLASEIRCRKPLAALYNGVDITQFRPRPKAMCRREVGLPEDGPIALYVGGLIHRKGVDVLLRALASDTGFQEQGLSLFLAGEGPQLSSLRAQASAMELEIRVNFVGKVSKNQMHLWMGAADMLVLPSYSEGRPNVVLEAMACGTPVIATAVNGTREVVTDEDDGLLFEPGDAVGLARCMTRLLVEPELAERLSANGPEKIRRLGLSWQAHGRRLMGIYHDILDN